MAQQPATARRETTPMDALQGTMNLLLTVIGQSLNQPARLRDPQQRMKMQSVFPSANLRFHEALDRMEEEINMAQNILKRDLALHRVMEKQKAERALEPHEQVKQEAQVQKDPDVAMVDKPVEQSQTATTPQVKGTAPTPATAPMRQMEPVKPKEEVAPPLPASQPAPVALMVAAPAPQPTVTTSAEQPDQSLMTGTSGPDEMDISEFFGDGDDDLDGGDTAIAVDDAQLDSLADFGDSNADVSSLLPGLESYANISDDSAMPDVPTTSAPENVTSTDALPEFSFGDLPAPQADSTAQQAQPDNNTQPDFGDIDFAFDAGGGGDGDGGQQGDNTFNDLFDMDQYDFGGGGGGGDGQDINDWMKSL